MTGERLAPGTVLEDKYCLERPIAEGGTGAVYLATQIHLGKAVAVKVLARKVLAREVARDTQALRRFYREAVVIGGLGHPHIVQVLDFGTTEAGEPFIVMELLDGEDLEHRMHRKGRLSPQETLAIVKQAASSLTATHEIGVIHRDLKPANIFLSKASDGGDSVKVLDFGVGMLRSGSDSSVLGTPNYMSPEQAKGDDIDERTDQWALACIAWKCLAGETPFAADSLGETVVKIVCERPLLPRVPGLPPRVEEVILRALAKDPGSRFSSVREFAVAFESAMGAAPADLRFAPGPLPRPLDGGGSGKPPGPLDENVQFSVYRPRAVAPGKWYPMLAFAHLSEPREGEEDQDPLAEVVREVQKSLGEQIEDYQDLKTDSAHAVPREGEITFVPVVPGVTFNPPSRTFLWLESVHKEEFRLMADGTLAGSTASGRLTVYLGSLILADIALRIRVGQAAQPATPLPDLVPAHARPYRKIFASYSRKDEGIVVEFERYVETLGDRYLRDCRDLRAGEAWCRRLMQLIEQSDLFQLFWSTSSMRSRFVRQEWEHALSLRRQFFVRPVYWEEPLPATADLPPEELRRLTFQKIAIARNPTTVARPTPSTTFYAPCGFPGKTGARPSATLARSVGLAVVVAVLVLLAIAGGLWRSWKDSHGGGIPVSPLDASMGPPATDASIERLKLQPRSWP